MRVGGIAAALEGLAPCIGQSRVEVHVVTCGSAGGAEEEEQAPGLFIHRVQVPEFANDFIHWVHLLNSPHGASRRSNRALACCRRWQRPKRSLKKVRTEVEGRGATTPTPTGCSMSTTGSAFSPVGALKHRYHLPMLSTIHATEFGRNSGIYTEIQRYINQCEWDLQWESWRVIVCSGFMRGEVEFALGTPGDKIDVIYNGVDTGTFEFDFSDADRACFPKSICRAL